MSRTNTFKHFILIIFLIILQSCANRTIVVNYSQLQVPSEIKLKLENGDLIEGIAIKKSSESIILQKAISEEIEIKRNSIAEIKKFDLVLDVQGNLVSQKEILGVKNNKSATIYTLLGGALSFGGSLLISSMASRGSDSEFNIANPISISGGILGAILFNRIGNKRDYDVAIEQVKEGRKHLAEHQLQEGQGRLDKIQQQIKIEKTAKAKLEEERKELETALKKKKNK